ncbi:DUF2141 domain-containing protein [Caenispirillum bisanense]|uniref:Uncharacterized conserved protein, DUF2141 family n=1 Tax=Caenispirillum bisanense TaxID=414052 RepID=A0A286G225_9PROT|nr:DUF2141 domain-containing protein [Caenispirillum bisanense]SOD89543.1 Uncharacterized conserved protein, DUF2141 family [Caenispirillum bisanense]
MPRAAHTLALAACLAVAAAPSAWAAGLTVTVEGVRDDRGDLRIALFDRPETFGETGKQRTRLVLPAAPGEVTAVFADVAPGTYAVTVYHDADRNGELNRALGLLPSEGWGVSNSAGPLSRPRWETASFSVPEAGATVRIRLHY